MARFLVFCIVFIVFLVFKLIAKGASVVKEAGSQAYRAAYAEEDDIGADVFEYGAAHAIIGLLTTTAKSDGRVSEAEAIVIQSTIDQFVDMVDPALQSAYRRSLILAHRKALKENGIGRYLRIIEDADLDRGVYVTIVRQLIGLSAMDGFTTEKRNIIYRVALRFMISRADVDAWIASVENGAQNEEAERQETMANGMDPYEVLEVSREDSFEAIKRKYRELVRKFHPDTLAAKGLDEAFVEFAKRKMQQINEAYEIIRRQYESTHAAAA
ncbi:J domain-containing protein [Hydrogenimonas sp.]